MNDVIRRDSRSEPFFDAAAADRLLIKRCAECGRWFPAETPGCTECGAADLEWAQACGHGALVSWAVAPGLPGRPTVLALVELDEGPWLHTQLDPAALDPAGGLRAGMRVTARFVHPEQGESYPVFWPGQAQAPPRRTGPA
ncbi:MAG: Zn-ribbon domain-containing OB-fold protein [Micromonosporaceae bacterium]